jgi:hypothetical protein
MTRPYHAMVGFSPFRRQRARPGDVVMVVVTCGITLGLVLWACLGR